MTAERKTTQASLESSQAIVDAFFAEITRVFAAPVLLQHIEELYVLIVADGPGASGKGTLAEYLQKEFDFIAFSTGLFYRAVTAWYLERKFSRGKTQDRRNLSALQKEFSHFKLSIVGDVTGHTNKLYFKVEDRKGFFLFSLDELRTHEIEAEVSFISGLDFICYYIDEQIINLVRQAPRGFVDGRDGHQKFGQFRESKAERREKAEKFEAIQEYLNEQEEDSTASIEPVRRAFFLYLYASSEELERRALHRLLTKKQQEQGLSVVLTEEEIEEEATISRMRTEGDFNREHGRLLRPQEAQNSNLYDLVLCTDGMTPQEVSLYVLAALYLHLFPDSGYAMSFLQSVDSYLADKIAFQSLIAEGLDISELLDVGMIS